MQEVEELLRVGRVWRPHGVRGECKIIPESDDPERLMELDAIYLGPDAGRATRYAVESARMQRVKRGPLVLFGLEDIEDRDQAAALRGAGVFAEASSLPGPGDQEAYIHDLIGLPVVDTEGAPVGTLTDILQPSAQYIYVVTTGEGRDIMIPAVETFIKEVDFENEKITVNLIEGLFE